MLIRIQRGPAYRLIVLNLASRFAFMAEIVLSIDTQELALVTSYWPFYDCLHAHSALRLGRFPHRGNLLHRWATFYRYGCR